MKLTKYLNDFAVLIASVWVGGMWVIGFVVAPTLFQSLPDKMLAGQLAGKMFSAVAYIGVVCALYLLVYQYVKYGNKALKMSLFWLLIGMLAFTVIGQFGLQPILANLKSMSFPHYVMDSSYAGQFRFWHGVSSLFFLIQSLLGLVLLVKLYRPAT